jgi:hypothetical protein
MVAKRHPLAGIAWPEAVRMQNPVGHAPLQMHNRVQAEQVRNGEVIKRIDHRGNLMCTFGLNAAAEMLCTSESSGSEWAQTMAIGTHTVAENSEHSGLSASTQLCDAFSRSDAGNMTARFLGTFSSDGNAAEINEVGLMASNVGNDSMIARSMLGTDSINRGSADEIRVTYDIIAGTA